MVRRVDVPGAAAADADDAQRRALDTDEDVGVDDEVEEAEDGADDTVVGLGHLVAAVNGTGVAVAARRRPRRRSALGV